MRILSRYFERKKNGKEVNKTEQNNEEEKNSVGQWAPERILSLNAPYRGVVACRPLGGARNLSEV